MRRGAVKGLGEGEGELSVMAIYLVPALRSAIWPAMAVSDLCSLTTRASCFGVGKLLTRA